VAGENQSRKSLNLGLAFVAGIGLILMVIAAAVGVISGDSIDSGALGVFFAIGAAMLISGIVAWFAVLRPDKHFDDINQPVYHGHHDEH
jgi:Na+-driven multidrug efflux pump